MRFCFCLSIISFAGLLGAEPPASTVAVDRSSGRLVRQHVATRVIQSRVVTAGVSPKAEDVPALPIDADISRIVETAAQRHQVDPLLVHSVIQVESAYNKFATSPKGAQGLMQLIPATARELGVTNVFDPRQNIEAGVKYLKQLQAQFKDDRLALAAYNAGPGAVSRYGWIPPYSETQNYVYQVGKRYGEAKRVETKKQQAAALVPAKSEGPRPIEEFVDSDGRLHLRNR